MRYTYPRNHALADGSEITVVCALVLLGILAFSVRPRLGSPPSVARIRATQSSIDAIRSTLQKFKRTVGRYPTTKEGLDALLTKPANVTDEHWKGPYLKEWPKDSWGNDFLYRLTGEANREFDLISAGPDKKMGTGDDIREGRNVK